MGYLDICNGGGLRSTKIVTNADGSEVWLEPARADYVLAPAADRSLLQSVAAEMGARMTDPTGFYKQSIQLEARSERGSINRHYDSSPLSTEYNDRSRRECLDKLQESVDEELGKIS